VRTVADPPWQGVAVQLRLDARRFRCLHPTCPQRIFCERLPGVVAPYGRRTLRLDEALHLIGVALGGEAGARLACRLGMRVSPETLLRGVRRLSSPVQAPTYAEAAREGAPHAIQVADRWHLLKNMGDTVQRFMTGKQGLVQQAAAQVMAGQPWEPTTIHGPVAMLS
jgi:transposase